MDEIRDVAAMLLGEQAGEEFAKSIMGDTAAEKDKRKRQVTAGLSAVGAAAGAYGLGVGAHEIHRRAREAKTANPKITRRAAYRAGLKSTPRAVKMLIPLEIAGLTGEVAATKILHGDTKRKKPIAKSEPGGSDLHIPGKREMTLKAVDYGAQKTKQKAPELKRGALKFLNEIPQANAVKEKKKVSKSVTWEGEISKVDTDKRQVFGWASIVEINGEPVVDLQGDYIDHDELEKSAYDYVIKSRKGGNMHLRDGNEPVHVSDMIESFLVTPEKKEKLGLPDEMPTGWWVGYQINDDDAWNLVKSGQRTGFSIHGRGQRTPYEDFGKALFEPPPHQRRPAGTGGKRKAGRTKIIPINEGGKHKWKAPTPGRGRYVNAPNNPHWSHNVGNTRFWANAAINNPTHTVAGAAVAGAALGQTQRKKLSEEGKRNLDTATGAAVAGGAAHAGQTKGLYTKVRDYQKHENNLDWADPKDVRNPGKHLSPAERKKFKDLKSQSRRAGGKKGMTDAEQIKATSLRQQTAHFNANFPEGYKTSKIRREVGSGKAFRRINRNSLLAAAAGGGVAYGAHKVKEHHG